MRVLNIVFEDRIGGPTRRIVKVGKRLSERHVETILCLPAGTGNAAHYAQECGISVRRIDFERIPRPSDPKRVIRWAAFTSQDVMRFVRLFREEKPDIVHVNGAFFIAPAIAAKLLRIPLAWHLNDTIVPQPVAPIFGAFVSALADQIVVAAKAVARHYGVDEASHEVIYAPVDVDQFEDISRDTEGKMPRVGLLANRLPTKGVEYFIEAVALVRSRRKDTEFALAGAAFPNHLDYYRRTNEMIAELGLTPALRDYGFLSSVEDLLRDLDILVSSSPTMEASPMVILEGMAAGLPIVATDVGGVREILLQDPGRPAGIVVAPRSSEAIAVAVLELLAAPEKAARMGENGRYLAKEYFSLDKCAGEHLEVYRELSKNLVGRQYRQDQS